MDPPYIGGVFGFAWALNWTTSLSNAHVPPGRPIDFAALLRHRPLLTADSAAVGVPVALYRRFLSHPTFDAFWRPLVLTPAEWRRIRIPSLAFSGW